MGPVFWSSRSGIALIALVAAACSTERAAPLDLVVGKNPDERLQFTPTESLAEFVEVPDGPSELRLRLAAYPIECGKYVPPTEQQASVSVVVTTPPGQEPTPGTYGWSSPDAGLTQQGRALPSARIGRRSYVFEPGGSVRLTRVDLSPDGLVQGLLDFEYPGDGQRPATRLQGRFSAKLCRLDRAEKPSSATEDTGKKQRR